jgi:hypothetical protein
LSSLPLHTLNEFLLITTVVISCCILIFLSYKWLPMPHDEDEFSDRISLTTLQCNFLLSSFKLLADLQYDIRSMISELAQLIFYMFLIM